MIRQATVKDVDTLIVVAKPFLRYSMYAQYTEIDNNELAFSLCNMIDNGVIFVAEYDGQIVGGLVGAINNFWFNRNTKMASELGWWVNEEHRGKTAGIRLLQAFEHWAKEKGADVISLSDLRVNDEYPAGGLYEKLGYQVTERAHVKGLI